MQLPDPTGTQQAPSDTVGGTAIREVGETVERVTQVRSWADLWELAGRFQGEVLEFGAKLLLAVLVLAFFAAVYVLLARALTPAFERSRLEADVRELTLAVFKYSLLGFGVIVALDQLGFNITGVLAGLGVLGLALGFAAKDTLANFIAGITILWDRPFRVGDRVEIDGEFGLVKRITLRSTRIHTNSNRVVIIPNQNVANNKIVNHTMQASLRLDVPFAIAYKEDIDSARQAVLRVVEGDDRIRDRPAPNVVLAGLGESSVDLELRIWLKNPHTEVPLEPEYLERIKKALDAAGIEIPFPHLSVYVERLPRTASRDGEERP